MRDERKKKLRGKCTVCAKKRYFGVRAAHCNERTAERESNPDAEEGKEKRKKKKK